MPLLAPLFVCLWGMVTFTLALGVFLEGLEEGDPRAVERGMLVGALWLPGLVGLVLFLLVMTLVLVAGELLSCALSAVNSVLELLAFGPREWRRRRALRAALREAFALRRAGRRA